MNGLDFLSVEAAAPEGRFRPLARSPMERQLRDAGAEFEERDGWLVAVRVPGEEERRPVVNDLTHLHRVHEGEDGALVAFHAGDVREPVVVGFLWNGDDRPPESTSDVTAGYAAMGIEGRGATTVLRRITELDLGRLPAAGAVAHVRALVLRDAPDAYRLLFEQEYGHYLWEVVVDAAEPLGGGPGGTP